MSRPNIYGFDFLKADHSVDFGGIQSFSSARDDPVEELSWSPKQRTVDVSDKSDLEKQYDVIQFLQSHRSSGLLPPNVIYKATGIDLADGGKDQNVTKMLIQNAKIRVEEIPDPENPSLSIPTFGYQAKFNNIMNKSGLLAQINRSKNGVRRSDLLDSYDGAEIDIKALLTAGDVLGVKNTDDKDIIFFPRGELFLVEMDGHISLSKRVTVKQDTAYTQLSIEHRSLQSDMVDSNDYYAVYTDVDPRKQIRRGEAIWAGGQWFRVSSAVKAGASLEEQPSRAQAPPTVTLRKDMSKKNDVDGYIRPFDNKMIPLDERLRESTIKNLSEACVAWTTLRKLASGRSGLTKEQILSSNATTMNPESLASAITLTNISSQGSVVRRGRVSHGINVMGSRNVAGSKGGTDSLEDAKKAASDPSLIYGFARRHGVTLDVRDMYLATQSDVPESESDLHNLMVKYKLKDSSEPIRRPKIKFVDPNMGADGKPKKKRYYERKGQRFTNVHLRGTEIGAALVHAAEKQHSGEAVGDGGM
jgi:hypothetical protein